VQQLLQRRDFSKRLKENRPLSVTELIYPLLVGYDSVHLSTDIEIGGTDQLFNFVASREIQKAYGQPPEVIITLPLLEGVDGKRKMSKSLGNAIGVDDEPHDMYGKLMSISDATMLKYYELLSDVSLEELEVIKRSVIEGRENPMLYKQRLAKELVGKYHGIEAALSAEEYFNQVHRRRSVPQEVEKIEVLYSSEADLGIIRILKETGRVRSNSEARRLIEQRGVKIDGEIIQDIDYSLPPKDGQLLQIGKRYFRGLYFKKERNS
jgi:tyrosyl-tRNA synthetase